VKALARNQGAAFTKYS
jgi:hypothetical protein